MGSGKQARCGYVGLVGRPNVGKSTLLNHLLGRKLSITSRKPQTTRHNLLGVDTVGDTQLIYLDTPGIHEASSRALNRMMVRNALHVLADVDVIVMLVEARRWTAADDGVLAHVVKAGTPCLCALNKIDQLARPDDVLPAIAQAAARHAFAGVLPISALRGKGLDTLRDELVRRVPEGPFLFDAGTITDRPAEFMIAEIVREKALRRLGDEIPHRLNVVVDQIERKGRTQHIDATLQVERASQKGIVIGKLGARLKAIGTDARGDIELLLGSKVMLRLWVKVKSGWTNDERELRRLGFD